MKKRPNLTYLVIAFTFGVVGISELATGRSELLAFLVLAVAFLIIGTNDGAARARRRARKGSLGNPGTARRNVTRYGKRQSRC